MGDLGERRHHARERALEIFYESSIKERPIAAIVNELPIRPDEYSLAVLYSAESNKVRAEELITAYAIDWPLDRIALVDRLIMTMAVGEMLMDEHPPKAVILDEAVELAKTYSTEGSPAFVNGVLASIAERLLT